MPGILVEIAEPLHWGDAYKFLSALWGMTKVSPFLSESIPVRGGGAQSWEIKIYNACSKP
jgi:hypothetical protein